MQGEMHGVHDQYEAPAVTDYGDLWAMTATFHPLLGQAGSQELSFSSPDPYDPGDTGGVQQNATSQNGVASGGASGGGSGGGTGGGAGGGGGGKLPFTGLATALVAGVGAGLVSAGDALRRAVRRKPNH
jgi:hypothetical protein